jgi:glycosyltransferase involved in cell wall biosynthesis
MLGKKKILFVCHDASRTGAPMVLLHFLKWLKINKKYDFSILLKTPGNGDLVSEFRDIAPTYIVFYYGKLKRILNEYFTKIVAGPRPEHKIPTSLFKNKFDLIYINTVDGLNLAVELKSKFKCPIICHVHENEFTINFICPDSLSEKNKACVDHYIAASESTRTNLVKQHNIDIKKISLVYEFIPVINIVPPTLGKEAIKKELGISNEFIVGGSGLTSWRKGVDLFVRLAFELNKIQPDNNMKFLWVGSVDREFKFQWLYEGGRLNLIDKVIFSGKSSAPQNLFQLFDLFTLTSREDPFPLVVLESAALCKSVLFFENSGGIEELFTHQQSGGVKVPYGDVQQMAIEILRLEKEDKLRLEMGREAAKIVSEYDVNIAAPFIVDVIEILL